jgi:hypothetical protein
MPVTSERQSSDGLIENRWPESNPDPEKRAPEKEEG